MMADGGMMAKGGETNKKYYNLSKEKMPLELKRGIVLYDKKRKEELQVTSVLRSKNIIQFVVIDEDGNDKEIDNGNLSYIEERMSKGELLVENPFYAHFSDGGTTKLARGGFQVGRWYRDSSGEEFKYVGEDMKGNTLFNDGVKTLKKPIEDFSSVKEEKLFGWFAKGGVATGGKFMVKFYLKESPNDVKEKIFDDRDGAEFFFDTIQDDDDVVVMPIEEVVEEVKAPAPAKAKNLFSAAKPVPVAKTATKKRERVQVDGISDEIERYDALKAIINNAKAEQEIIGGRLKEIGREKFLDLYEDRGFRPANFDLADGNENILLEVTDKYLKVEPEKAAILENYDGLLEVKTTYEFNAEILEKSVSDSMTVGDVVSMLIQDSKLLSDSDKENLIKAKTTMRVPKGTIDRLLDYDNPREVFNLISPILALK